MRKTKNIIKWSNCTFDLNTNIAISYGWRIFLMKIGDAFIFNKYKYSVTTSRHQYKVKQYLLANLGINPKDIIAIEVPRGLQALEEAPRYYTILINILQDKIAIKSKTKATTSLAKLQVELDQARAELVQVNQLIKKMEKIS